MELRLSSQQSKKLQTFVNDRIKARTRKRERSADFSQLTFSYFLEELRKAGGTDADLAQEGLKNLRQYGYLLHPYIDEAIKQARRVMGREERVQFESDAPATEEGEVGIGEIQAARRGEFAGFSAAIASGQVLLWESPVVQDRLDVYEREPGGLAKRILIELHLGKPEVLPDQPPELSRPVRKGEHKGQPRAVHDLIEYHFTGGDSTNCPTCKRISRYLGRVRVAGGGRLTAGQVRDVLDTFVSQLQS
jgi:hypothetical protein